VRKYKFKLENSDIMQVILPCRYHPVNFTAHLTIADLPLITGTVCLEAMGLDLSPFPRIQTWYEGFKTKNLLLWGIGIQGLEELSAFKKNPPDLSHVKHPIHPTDKSKLK